MSKFNFKIQILEKILNFILPQRCLGCSKNGNLACEDCLLLAPRCEKYLENDTFAVFSYQNKFIKEVIKALKYKGLTSLGAPLGQFIYNSVLEEISLEKIMQNDDPDDKIMIVPVPLHKDRLAKRGFNQSEEIARTFFELSDKNLFSFESDALLRIKATESQVSVMDRKNRLKNLKGAFAVKYPEKIKGKTILLVDDVITTGATIEECRDILKRSGAKEVIAVAVAH